MAEITTIARPYAKAVFQTAEASNTFDEWSSFLELWSQVAEDERIRKLFHDPKVKPKQLIALFGSTKALNEHAKRFLTMLSKAKRWEALPEISRMYKELLAERNQTLRVEVSAAEELTEDQKDRVRSALSRRFDRDVVLDINIDKSLIAGAHIKVGDKVWDATLRRRLTRFREKLLG